MYLNRKQKAEPIKKTGKLNHVKIKDIYSKDTIKKRQR